MPSIPLGTIATIEGRISLKHSVHKVCVPNLHIAHFSEGLVTQILQFVDFLSGT
jgi:hypothetical protein